MNSRRIFAAVSVGHLGIDIFNSMGPVLLAFLKAPLGLSAAQIGLAVGLYQFLAGTTQPAFGWVVDRVGSRFLGPCSVAFNLAFLALAVAAAATTGSFILFLIPFAVAAIASGAFHPLGVMHASTVNVARSATFIAIFFFCGQVGLATGPLLAGLALDRAGLTGIYWLVLVVAPVPLFMAFAMGPRRFHSPPPAAQPEEDQESAVVATPGQRRPIRRGVVALLALVLASRAWAVFGTIAFLPLLLAQQGFSSSAQGLANGLFLLGGAVTAVLAGAWSDRWGRRSVVFLTTLLGSLVLVFLPGSGNWTFVVALPCGALLGAAHSVLIVMAQSLLPWRRGLASGTALGFLFATGAVATWGIGELADRFDLAAVLQAGAMVGLVSACASLLLPRERPSRFAAAPAVSAILVVATLGLTLFTARPAAASLNGEINGQVRDVATGRPLAGAEIRITGDQLYNPRIVHAGDGGSYRAPGLPPGGYQVETTVDGYVTTVVENLVLVVGGVLRVDFQMRSGSASMLELVSSPLLDVVTGSDGNVLAGDDLRELPGSTTAVNLDLAAGLDAAGGDLSVNGWSPGFAIFRVDGQDRALPGLSAAAVDPRWVDQVRVRSMDFAAAMAGPHVDVITRSGGTEWTVNGGWSVIEPTDNGERLALRLPVVEQSPVGGFDRKRVDGEEATVFLGGPLRDKRARAFGGYSTSRTSGDMEIFGAGAPMTWKETVEQSVGKFNWWAGSASNLTLKHHSGSSEMDGRTPALLVLPSTDGQENSRSAEQTTSLNVEWGITTRLWLRVFAGLSDQRDREEPWQDAGIYVAAPAGGRAAGLVRSSSRRPCSPHRGAAELGRRAVLLPVRPHSGSGRAEFLGRPGARPLRPSGKAVGVARWGAGGVERPAPRGRRPAAGEACPLRPGRLASGRSVRPARHPALGSACGAGKDRPAGTGFQRAHGAAARFRLGCRRPAASGRSTAVGPGRMSTRSVRSRVWRVSTAWPASTPAAKRPVRASISSALPWIPICGRGSCGRCNSVPVTSSCPRWSSRRASPGAGCATASASCPHSSTERSSRPC